MIASAGTNRDITINLRYVDDPDNAAVMQRIAQQVQDVQARANGQRSGGGAGGNGNGGASPFLFSGQSRAKVISDENEAERRGLSIRERIAQEHAQERIRIETIASKEQEKLNKEQERETTKQGIAADRAGRLQEMASRRVLTSGTAVVHNMLDIGRAIALLGVAGEKDTEKIVHGFVKVYAGFSLVHAGISTVVNLSKAWDAVARASAAAAAAQAVGATMGGTAGLLGAIGSVGLGGLGAIGAGIGIAGLSYATQNSSEFSTNPERGFGTSSWNPISNLANSALINDPTSFFFSRTPSKRQTPKQQMEESEKALKRMSEQQRLQEEHNAFAAVETEYQKGASQSRWTAYERDALLKSTGRNPQERELSYVQGLRGPAAKEQAEAMAAYQQATSGTQEQVNSGQRALEATKRRYEVEQQSYQLTTQRVAQEASVLSQLINQKRAIEDQDRAQRNAQLSTAERIMQMTPGKRAQLQAGIDALDAGNLPSKKQLELLAPIIGADYRDKLGELLIPEAERLMPGFSNITRDTQREERSKEDRDAFAENLKKTTGNLREYIPNLKDNTSLKELKDTVEEFTNNLKQSLDSQVADWKKMQSEIEELSAKVKAGQQSIDLINKQRKAREGTKS
jgi:hypothetical protein